MNRGLGLAHTWSCRDERGGSLPDEVGSSPPKAVGGKEKDDEEGRMMRNDPLSALCWVRDEKMSRNTHAPSLPVNGRLTPARYRERCVHIGGEFLARPR